MWLAFIFTFWNYIRMCSEGEEKHKFLAEPLVCEANAKVNMHPNP